jgi:hypothetical protein
MFVIEDEVLWPDAWILLLDNAQAHDIVTLEEVSAKKSITKFGQPPFLQDWAPCNFQLFEN